jgi:hypothetical protein
MFFSSTIRRQARLVREAGFAIVSAEEEGQLEGEHEVTFLWVLAQKTGESL